MTFCAQYGNTLSFYGNIQLGRWRPIPQQYGGFPQQVPASSPMLNWQEPVELPEPNSPAIDISENITIIRRLKAQLAETENSAERTMIREQMAVARKAKEEAFKLAARIDEEETFILLH